MKKRLLILSSAGLVFCVACLGGLPFLPNVEAPPPSPTVYPSNWRTNLWLVQAAAVECNRVTNMEHMTQSERGALLGYWVSVCRTNGTLDHVR